MRWLPLLAAAAVIGVTVPIALALGGDDEQEAGPAAGPSPSSAPRLWTGTATLLKTNGQELTLCGGGIATSLPPAGCGGAVVRGLDPMTVPGAKRYPNGTIETPSVKLVGTWDGKALTVTEEPVLATRPAAGAGPAIPGPSCPEPEGGWPFDKVEMQGWEGVNAYAAGQPDAGTPRVDDSQRILTVPFTGDLDKHRTAIAKLYDGPVCVEKVAHSTKELQDVFGRAQADLKARGLSMLSGSGGGSFQPFVEITVVAVTPEERKEIEATYDGLLRLDSFLVRVGG